jgi:molecular chaperone GrpE
MSGQPNPEDRKPDSETSPPPSGSPEASEAPTPPEADAVKPKPTADDQLAEAQSQVADLTDRLLRAHAEMENMRKRAEREKADIAKFAISKFAGDAVTVADNFKRAVAAVPSEAAEQHEALKALLDGVLMMEREFLKVLERNGVRRVDPNGEIFNPHVHQAVMERQDADVPSGTIVQVFEAGYSIEDRVLRPAMVAVAKGGPKPGNNANGKPEASQQTESKAPEAGEETAKDKPEASS